MYAGQGVHAHEVANGQTGTGNLTLGDALSVLEGVKQTSKGWLARCPAHDDHSPSLGVGEGREGRLLLTCWTGCRFSAIMSALRDRHSAALVREASKYQLAPDKRPSKTLLR